MKKICNQCGERLGKNNGRAYFKPGKCDFCGRKQYVVNSTIFGVFDEEDRNVEELKKLFGLDK